MKCDVWMGHSACSSATPGDGMVRNQNQKASRRPFHFAIPYSFLTAATASPVFPVCLLIQVTNIGPEFLQAISTAGYQQEAGTHRHFR